MSNCLEPFLEIEFFSANLATFSTSVEETAEDLFLSTLSELPNEKNSKEIKNFM